MTFSDEQAMTDVIESKNGKELDGRNIIVNQHRVGVIMPPMEVVVHNMKIMEVMVARRGGNGGYGGCGCGGAGIYNDANGGGNGGYGGSNRNGGYGGGNNRYSSGGSDSQNWRK